MAIKDPTTKGKAHNHRILKKAMKKRSIKEEENKFN